MTVHRLPQSGFTLTELMVTVGILIILTGGALINMRGANAEQELVQAAEGVQLAIYQARGLALSPAINRTVGSPGYEFVILDDQQSYQVRELPISRTDFSPGPIVVIEGRLPRDVAFAIGDFSTVVFLINDQGVVSEPSGTDGVAKLLLKRSGRYQGHIELTIYTASGQIEVGDLQSGGAV